MKKFLFFKTKDKETREEYFVVSACKKADIRTKYLEYPQLFKTKNDARHFILSYCRTWVKEILEQDENYYNKPAGAWKTKSNWLIIEKKTLTNKNC